MCLNRARTQCLWPDRQFKQFSVTQWIEEAVLAPLFSVQGVWHLLQLTALQKDEPFVKDATRKMAPRWSGGGFSCVSDAHIQHTHTHIFLAFLQQQQRQSGPWLAGPCPRSVNKNSVQRVTDRGGSSQSWAPVFDPQRSPWWVCNHVELNTCYDVGLVSDQSEQTFTTREGFSRQTSERCAAAASPSGSLEIYFMVIAFC